MPGPVGQGIRNDEVSPEEAKNAIESYVRAVETRLQPGLDAACKLRDGAFERLAEVEQMSNALDVLDVAAETCAAESVDESGRPLPALETRVNIGEQFYVNAHAHKLDPVIVDVGLGIMVEMSRKEARQFVERRKSMLEAQAERHTKRIAEVQAQLKTVMRYLSELKIASFGADVLADRSLIAED